MVNIHHDLGERIQALALVEAGVPVDHVAKITTFSVSQINRIRKKAHERGFDPKVSPIIRLK